MKNTTIILSLFALLSSTACHSQRASVLPKGDAHYEVVAQGATEHEAFQNAESEARYTCKKEKRQLIVKNKESVYQGADKNAKGDVNGGNVALAYFTGQSGKERNSDDYRVTLAVACE